MAKSVVHGALAFLAACGPGAPGDPSATASTSGDPPGSSSTVSSGAPPTTSTSSTTSTTSTTTATTATTTTAHDSSAGVTTTSAAPDGTSTTGTSTSTGFDTCDPGHTGDTIDDPGDVPDCVEPQVEWKEAHHDCIADCSTETELHGEGPAAGLHATRITFNIVAGVCGKGIQLQRFHIGSNPLQPAATVWAGLDCGLDPWLGSFPVTGRLADDTPFEATLTLDSYSGDWQSPDPVDPPRLFGSFTGDLVGSFEAVHCGKFDIYYDNCA